MKRKRLDRDGWGFQGFPYAQMRLEHGDFRGRVCLIRLVSGEACCWELPRAGRVAVCGALLEAAMSRWDGAETFRKNVRGEMQEPGSETAFPCGKNLS